MQARFADAQLRARLWYADAADDRLEQQPQALLQLFRSLQAIDVTDTVRRSSSLHLIPPRSKEAHRSPATRRSSSPLSPAAAASCAPLPASSPATEAAVASSSAAPPAPAP